MNAVFVDIGELGWSIVLCAHIRYLKRHTDQLIAVITYPARQCLYKGLADLVIDVPPKFCSEFDLHQQTCFGLYKIPPENLKKYFVSIIPKGYVMPDYFSLGVPLCKFERCSYIYEPFNYSKELSGRKEILVFPRCRQGYEFRKRNLRKEFYIDLIQELCINFQGHTVRSIGTTAGAYSIERKAHIGLPNYGNGVTDDGNLQDFIDRCQLATAAVGAQSAPPKISLLQGVPTFMIGHEGSRHVIGDNWMHTKAGFYALPKMNYASLNEKHCIDKIVDFVKECL